jgi:hypothetical protein
MRTVAQLGGSAGAEPPGVKPCARPEQHKITANSTLEDLVKGEEDLAVRPRTIAYRAIFRHKAA